MSRGRTDSRESKKIRAIIICRGQSDKKTREVHLLAHGGMVGARSLATLGGEMERKSELGRGRGRHYKKLHCFEWTMLHIQYFQYICLLTHGRARIIFTPFTPFAPLCEISDRERHTWWGVLVSERPWPYIVAISDFIPKLWWQSDRIGDHMQYSQARTFQESVNFHLVWTIGVITCAWGFN